jgi:hypothetical protein
MGRGADSDSSVALSFAGVQCCIACCVQLGEPEIVRRCHGACTRVAAAAAAAAAAVVNAWAALGHDA